MHKYSEMFRALATFARLANEANYVELAPALDEGYRSAGWPAVERKTLDVLVSQHRADASSTAYQIALFHADLREKDKAFDWLEATRKEHDFYLRLLLTNRKLDPLRSDPRFAALVTKMGLSR